MINHGTARGASTTWILLLTAASTITTLALACATPFTALAALAAVHMRRRDGIALIGVAWLASQVVGFCVLDYPRDANTFGWAAAIGVAAALAVVAGSIVADRLRARGATAALVGAYVAAFIAFKAVILAASFALGGVGAALSGAIMAEQFARNAAILVALLLFYRALTAAGVPTPPAPRARALA